MKKNTFKSFLIENSSYIEDLQIDKFLSMIRRLDTMTITPYIVGKSIKFGIDQRKVYVSIDKEVFFEIKDIPETSNYDDIRLLLAGILQYNDIFCSFSNRDFEIEGILIFSNTGNYFQNATENKLILTKSTKNLDDFLHLFSDSSIKCTAYISHTNTGIDISKSIETIDFKVSIIKNLENFGLNVNTEIEELLIFLNTENELATIDLEKSTSNRQLLNNRSHDLTDERNNIRNIIASEYKEKIKTSLFNQLQKIKKYDGYVLTSKSGDEIKVVDKTKFDNNETIKAISGVSLTANPDATLQARGGILGDSKSRIINLLGVEGLTNAIRAKAIFKQFIGETPQQTIINFANNLKDMSFNSTKIKIESILISSIKKIDDTLTQYNNVEYPTKVDSERESTLLTFAESRDKLISQLEVIKTCSNMIKLVAVLFGKQIKQLHNGMNNAE